MPIKFIRPGLFTTVQDLGRPGYRSMGISPGGAMDTFAAIAANLLVGNEEWSPVIEMHFPAPAILFGEEAVVSITGADFGVQVDDQPAASWQTLVIARNQLLSFPKNRYGSRAYLAIRGGLNLAPWLNSFSTHCSAVAGGYHGRALKKDDNIGLLQSRSPGPVNILTTPAEAIDRAYQPASLIRCIPGPEWGLLPEASRSMFSDMVFTVTAQSDRMGYRLLADSLAMNNPFSMISSPVDFGTVQLLPNGQLIVLMADHQTTGGYPRIAGVITADLPRTAQLPIHSTFRFEVTNLETASEALFSMAAMLEPLKNIPNGNDYAH